VFWKQSFQFLFLALHINRNVYPVSSVMWSASSGRVAEFWETQDVRFDSASFASKVPGALEDEKDNSELDCKNHEAVQEIVSTWN